jgi:Tfp pilus assembly protein PilF
VHLPDTKAAPWPAPATGRWLLAVLVTFICSSAFAADIPALVRASKPAVVQLLCYDQDDQLVASGTGFFISPDGKLLTNYHVIRGVIEDSEIVVAKSDTKRYQLITIGAADEKRDVAELIFEVGGENVPYLSLGSSAGAVEGERVLVIGNPEGLTGTVSDGIISGFRKNRTMIQITAPVSPGSSGSPVLDESGNVIGVAVAIYKEGQNLNFAISADAVKVAIAKDSPPGHKRSKQELSAQEIWRFALNAFENKDYRDARSLFGAVISRQPDNAEAYFRRGAANFFLKKYEAAASDFTQAIQLKTDYANAYDGRAMVYHILKRYGDAIKDYTEAIRFSPNRAIFYKGRAEAYDSIGDHVRAKADRKKVTELGGH